MLDLARGSTGWLLWLIIAPWLIQLLLIWLDRRRAAFVAGLATIACLGLDLVSIQLPYIAYPLRAADALTDPAAFHVMISGLAMGLVIVVPALILIYRLAGEKPR